MKEELQGKLVDILTSIQTAAGKASDFAMDELPGIAQEYVAFGRPILASDVGAFSDVAARGGAAVVPPEDPAVLHDAIARLLADERERERLGARAAELAAGEYSWDAIGERTLALYARLLGR